MSLIDIKTIDFCPGGTSASIQTSKNVEMLLTETSISVTPDSGYDGIARVNVTHAPVESSTAVAISTNGTHTITPGDGYDATMQVIATVSVPGKTETSLSQTITSNGTYDYTPGEGEVYSAAHIAVNVSGKTEETLTSTIRDNGVHHFDPTSGNVFSSANITVDVNVEPAVPSDEIWYTTPDGTVVNFTDLTALGVTYGGPTVISNTYSSGKGIIKFAEPVTWIGFKLIGGSLKCGPQWLCAPQVGVPVNKLETVTLPDSVTDIAGYNHPSFNWIGAFDNCAYLTGVHFGSGVTKIDSGTFTFSGQGALLNRLDITISTATPPTLGTTQSDSFTANAYVYVPTGSLNNYKSSWSILSANRFDVDEHLRLQNKSVSPSTSALNITADSPYVGLDHIAVSAVTSAIDANIQASNIKKDVQILGVTGTLEEGITPSGTLSISVNGSYDVTNYAGANVNVGGTDYRNQTGTITGLADLGWDTDSIGYANANLPHYTWENDNYAVSQTNKDLYGVVTKDNKDNYRDNTYMVYLPYFDTTGISWMYRYFQGFPHIVAIPILNTSSATNMSYFFRLCTNLITIPLIDTSNATNMQRMFDECHSLISIPPIDTSKVTKMDGLFYNCNSLTSIPIINTELVTDAFQMFKYCNKLKSIPPIDTSRVTNMWEMFMGCSSLTIIPTLNMNSATNTDSMFSGCSNLTNIPPMNSNSVTDATNMFRNCSKLKNISINFPNLTTATYMFGDCAELTTINQLITGDLTRADYMFSNANSLQSTPALNTGNITNKSYMDSMFPYSVNFTTVNGIDYSGLSASPDRIAGYNSTNSYITKFIVNGSISFTWNNDYGIKSLTAIDYDSVKSILTAMAACTNPETAKIMTFNRALQDQEGELESLIADCITKGWTITGLIIYTEIPNVYYTTTNGQVMNPEVSKPFGSGVNITSNTYVDGQGIMVLDNIPLEIVRSAFKNNTLVSMVVPYGVGTLGYASFADNTKNLTTIDLPSTLNKLFEYVFSGATSLTTVTVRATVPPTASYSIFNGCSSLAHIYVPAGSVDAYKAANTWSNYASIISAIPE